MLNLYPRSARSTCCAPMFCATMVLTALPMPVEGSEISPLTLLPMPYAAMAILPYTLTLRDMRMKPNA